MDYINGYYGMPEGIVIASVILALICGFCAIIAMAFDL